MIPYYKHAGYAYTKPAPPFDPPHSLSLLPKPNMSIKHIDNLHVNSSKNSL